MKTIKLQDLKVRLLSALLLAPLVLWVIWTGGAVFTVLVVMCATLSLYEWIGLAQKTSRKALFLLFGVVYVGASFWCAYTIRVEEGALLTMLLVVMVWASDIDAYFTGKIIGGPKMAAQISPNKTWAGLAGAMVSPAFLGVLFLVYQDGFEPARAAYAFGAGALIGVAGQAGDLLISFVKRRAGVKDSGNIIPGHGGLLDRIDALMLAIPVFLIILEIMPHVFGG